MDLFGKCTAGLLALSLLTLPAAGAVDQDRMDTGMGAAQTLNQLGLFRGAAILPDGSPDFQLGRSATRGEGLVMLIRLLGGENEALNTDYDHPFTDAGWADDYCGYAYEHRIANGVSPTAFGTKSPISQNHFLTLVLRALGYQQVDYRDPIPLARQVGLSYTETEDFLRCDMARTCLSALDCTINGTEDTLRMFLQAEGVIPPEAGSEILPPVPLGREPGPETQPYVYARVGSPEDLLPELVKLMDGRMSTAMLEVPAGQEAQYSQWMKDCTEALPDLSKWKTSWYPDSGVMNLELIYQDGARIMAYLEGKLETLEPVEQETLAEALRVRDTYTLSGMTDYEVVKAYHDYLVNNTRYLGGADASYDAAGPLLDGYGVCDGYSKAFDLLCYLSGVDCIRVSGEANGGPHAWNKVKVDGTWYNVDVTWDDPVSDRPVLRYDYFLVSDSTLSADHQWTLYPHWHEAPQDYQN